MSLLDYHDPVGWRFYVYGEDEGGDPLFSFWMNIDENTGVCLYERNDGGGMWLSTHHDADDEYEGQPPSEELKAVLDDLVRTDRGIHADRLDDLPAHERYFVRTVVGTIEQKGKAPDELLHFLEEITGTEVRLA